MMMLHQQVPKAQVLGCCKCNYFLFESYYDYMYDESIKRTLTPIKCLDYYCEHFI